MDQEVLIYDRKKQGFVPAIFHDDVTASQLVEAETQWKPIRDLAVQRLRASGKTVAEIQRLIQHAHWDWARKAGPLLAGLDAIRYFGIEVDGQWQGLVMLDLASQFAQLEPDRGKPLVYVEFLEVAPWNIAPLVTEPRYGIVGTRLVESAVRQSISEGFRGRIGLVALPQAQSFYERTCGMTRVEGAGHHGMAWYEMTQKAAELFLRGGQS